MAEIGKLVPKTKTKYVITTDHETRDKYGNGQMRYRIKLYNGDTPRTKEEIEADIKKIKDDQAEKNEAYKRRVLPETKNVKNIIAVTSPKEEIEIPQKEIKYEPLSIHLDENTGNTGAIIGSSKMGKSTLLMHIYKQYYQREVPEKIIAILFAQNSHIPMYKTSGLITIDRWCKDIIEGEKKIQKFSDNGHEFVNFIDDFIDLDKDMTLKNLLLTLRNSKISSYICLQYANLLNKASRSNVNNIFLFGQNTDEAAQVSVDCWLETYFKKMKIPKEEWVPYFKEVTKNHGFFHIHPQTNTVKICKV